MKDDGGHSNSGLLEKKMNFKTKMLFHLYSSLTTIQLFEISALTQRDADSENKVCNSPVNLSGNVRTSYDIICFILVG